MRRQVRPVRISEDEWAVLSWQSSRIGMRPSTLLREGGVFIAKILARHPNPTDLEAVLAEAIGEQNEQA